VAKRQRCQRKLSNTRRSERSRLIVACQGQSVGLSSRRYAHQNARRAKVADEPPAPTQTNVPNFYQLMMLTRRSMQRDPTRIQSTALLGVLDVVYGDIETSPLYAFREATKASSGARRPLRYRAFAVCPTARTTQYILCARRSETTSGSTRRGPRQGAGNDADLAHEVGFHDATSGLSA
jgi:hypothetical protein